MMSWPHSYEEVYWLTYHSFRSSLVMICKISRRESLQCDGIGAAEYSSA